MYKRGIISKTSIDINESVEGETIEQKMERVVNNGEPIKDGAPIIYTERKKGVEAQFDIRTDRFDIALDAMTAVSKSHTAKREEAIKEREAKVVKLEKGKEGDGGAESGQGTNKPD